MKALKRITPISVVSSIPLFALSIIFAFTLWPAEGRERIMSYEVLLVHAFPFLGAVAFSRASKWHWHIVRWICFAALLFLYLGTAYRMDQWIGVWTLLALGLANYLRIFFMRDPNALMRQMGARWGIALLAIFGLGILCGVVRTFILGQQMGITTDPWFGALFFLTLGACELTRVYDAIEETDSPSS